MIHSKSTRTVALVTLGVTAAGFLVSPPTDAEAQARRRRARVANVINLQTPLGLQGTRGAGDNVIIPFSLQDRSRARSNVEVQYGIDFDNDGVIYPGDSEVDPAQRTGQPAEYLPATEDRLDPRNTRKNRRPQLFSTAARIGAAHAYAWRSSADIESGSFPTSQFQYTPDGRLIEDPNNPGSYLFAETQPGVRVRVRSVRGRGRSLRRGAWAYSDAFALNNNIPPSLTIDEIVVPDPLANPPVLPNEIIDIRWTAFDDNSEDLNANGIFDELDGEDANGNNRLDVELVAGAFDYYELQPGDVPESMTLEQLAALDWKPCTNADPDGNPDAVRDAGGEIVFDGYPSAPVGVSGAGNQHVFRWNSVRDTGTVNGQFIVRARPFDVKREQGEYVYAQTPFTIDNWKIFNTTDVDPLGNPGTSDLAGGRVGLTVTSLTTVIAGAEEEQGYGGRTDPDLAAPKLAFLVAGGTTSTTGAGAGTTDAVLYRAGTTDAPTTTASIDTRPISLNVARAYHTATLLDDGRVLFAGGFDGAGTPTNTTELYDPLTHAITPGPLMAAKRARHAAVRLASGDVAIFGGLTQGTSAPLNSVEIYRFVPFQEGNGSFELLTNPGQTMAVGQHSLHAHLLADQHVLVTGGIDASGNVVQTAELLSPLVDLNYDGENDPTTKDPVFVKLDVGGMLDVVGGTNPIPPMLAARRDCTSTRLVSGHVLFAGGSGLSSLEIFNHEDRVFEAVNVNMEDGPRAQHLAVRMGDDSVLLAGGITSTTGGGTIVAAADIFKLGTRSAGQWSGSFLRVNGDMITPRRRAAASALPNGKVILAGGDDGATALQTLETFTPENAINRVPTASVALQSPQQSWAFGAPVQYRLVDAEGDDAFVTVQFSSDSKVHWRHASPQATTIGGDVAEVTTARASATSNSGATIDPIGRPEDHLYIWGMSQDITRPATGTTETGFNIRVTPFGAVQGFLAVSDPVEVLSNTKVIPTIYPLADRHGVDDPDRGGDIEIWVHLRDIDGAGSPSTPRPGETVQRVVFEYAVDVSSNGGTGPPDGQIRVEDGESWIPMTPAGSGSAAIRAITGEKDPSDIPVPPGKLDGKNVLEGLASWSEAPGSTFDDHPRLVPGGRPAAQGWHSFNWDSVYDMGAENSVRSTVWVRVTPFDADEGFTTVLRNEPGETKINIVRDQDGLWLDTFTPKGGNASDVKPNEAIDLLFNGLVLPESVDTTTLQATYDGAVVLGEYTIVQDAGSNQTLITFWPLVQSTVDDAPVYGVSSDPTVQQDGMTVDIFIPGYHAEGEPDDQGIRTLLPDNGGWSSGLTFTGAQTSTYLLVQNVETLVSYDVVSGNFDDTAIGVDPATIVGSAPMDGSLIAGDSPTTPIELTIDKVVDFSTVKSPNIKVFVDTAGTGVDSVIPGQWTVTNLQELSVDRTSITTRSTLTFVPFIQYPSGTTIKIEANGGLLSAAGNPIQGPLSTTVDGFATTYTIDPYTTESDTITEDFTGTDFEDDTVADRSNWGTDLCAPDTLTGLQIAPLGTGLSNLTVNNGDVITVTTSPREYDQITVAKGGILRIRVPSGPATLRARSITIDGVVDVSGEDGWSGAHGYTSSTSNTTGPTTSHTTGRRPGGAGHSGGGSGGDAINSSSSNRKQGGAAGVGPGAGTGGGFHPSYGTGYYYLSGGGGGGASFGNTGFDGTRGWYNEGSSYVGRAGSTYGSPDFDGGSTPLGGSGGGGGVTTKNSSYTFQGGGGGAGGGAVTFECTGDFKLAPSGYINGRGGDGGSKHFYGGSGGGGSGGGVLVRAGKKAVLDGIIDLRGGSGGPPGTGYYGDYYQNSNVGIYGTYRRGGDAGGGRLAVYAPNYPAGATDNVRVKGQFVVREYAGTIPTGPGGASNPTGSLAMFGGTASGNYAPGSGQTELHLSSMEIGSNRTVNLVSGSSSNPLTIYVDGDIDIDGTLTLNGRTPTYGYDTSNSYSPAYDGQGGYRITLSSTAKNGIAPSNLGSTAGGKGLANGVFDTRGAAATGLGGGGNKLKTTGTGLTNSRNWFTYYTGDAGGGGGGSASPGDDGWAPYAAPPKYNYFGALSDTTNKGVSPQVRHGITGSKQLPDDDLKHGGPGGAMVDPGDVTLSNFGTLAGFGGGGGNSGGFHNWSLYQYFGYAAHGGSGGGALALVAKGDVNIRGTIEAKGGDGNPPGATLQGTSYANWSTYSHSGGGGGSGGFVYVIGDNVNITPATSPTNGATISLQGGLGGGWRATRSSSTSTAAKYPTYHSYGAFGGNGGFGRLYVDYAGQLNGGNAVFNRYGHEESNGGETRRALYTALGGSARSGCLFAGGADFRSKWYDLKSVSPTVNSMVLSGVQGTYPTIVGQGAQSHPHNPGAGGTGEPNPGDVSAEVDLSSAILEGWRWFRFRGTLKRPTPASTVPVVDEIEISFDRDALPSE